jgi:hypothetical protein
MKTSSAVLDLFHGRDGQTDRYGEATMRNFATLVANAPTIWDIVYSIFYISL